MEGRRTAASSTPRRRYMRELIASLNAVAGAVSSAADLDEVLDSIVESAKLATDTDKTVLALTETHSPQVDVETIVVRGQRKQHPQEWWQERLEELGAETFEHPEVLVEHHPEQNAWLLLVPVHTKDRPVGVIAAINSADRPFTDVQVDFLAILAAFAAAAIENARLAEQSRYVLLASERDRVAGDIHDGVLQSMFSIALGLEVCKRQLSTEPDKVAPHLDRLQEDLNQSMTDLRRIVYDLRPAKLNELGLVRAIEYWVHQVTTGTAVRGRVIAEALPECDPSVEACLYRVAKESVSNVVKHSGASRFEVVLGGDGDIVTMTVSDDGRGFDVAGALEGEGGAGLGLRNIRQRVTRQGGRFEASSTPETGTRIAVELDCRGR